MRNFFTKLHLISGLIISLLLFTTVLNAQTAGNLTFSVTTTSTGNYSPKHVVAIWIEKADGTFVKTKLKKAATRVQWLNQWVLKSGSNVVDAITGSTISSHQTENIVWNGSDINGLVVADGNYKLWIQMAWANTNGPTYSIDFVKGPSVAHITPANQTNYLNMILDWSPAVGILESKKSETFSVSPNPITSQSTVNYSLTELSDVTIGLYDINGKLITLLTDENQKAGDYSISLSLNGILNPGMYFVKMNTGKAEHTSKIFILE